MEMFLLRYSTFNVKTKDCAGSRPFQHKLQHHILFSWQGFLTSPSMNYVYTHSDSFRYAKQRKGGRVYSLLVLRGCQSTI